MAEKAIKPDLKATYPVRELNYLTSCSNGDPLFPWLDMGILAHSTYATVEIYDPALLES
jgi:hypothetical protein